MANYYGTGRSNYVKVTDVDKFKALCKERGLSPIQSEDDITLHCALSDNEDGDINNYGYIDGEDELAEFPDFIDEVAKILCDDEVFIWVHVGSEKMRYVSGYTVAINSIGERKVINLSDIYEIAKELGKNISQAEY